ncbi:hypothetical protein [Actinotalea fermentans]|uniref:Uncharacterized protein n=1 Tax=Actinotalea fermentans TaxID=43671 RepID=A0A511YV14_9CELL|nr:hypothetical protein [Actinotalea fermentans]GEN79044.1 hypothetical protein AFE02nite_07780 [Actinotalea fermentans]
MKTRDALAIGALATVAATVATVTPEPTLGALNDVETFQIGVVAWRPAPADTTTGPQTAEPAQDPFSPLEPPAAAGPPTDEGADPGSAPDAVPDGQQDGSGQSTPPDPATDQETASPGSEPAAVPSSDTTASPAEEAPSATGTEGAGTNDGATSASPDPTSDG